MAKKELANFCSDFLSRDPDLKAAMDAISDQEQFAKTMVTVGKKAGFAFTEDDILEALGARSQSSQELTLEQLEAVAGGNKPASKGHTEYLIIKMNDVIVTS